MGMIEEVIMPTVINTNTTVSQINISTQKATIEAEFKALVVGLQTELAGVSSFVVRKKQYTNPELVAMFQSRIDAAEQTKADRTKLHASVVAERALHQQVMPLRAGIKSFLQSRYGKDGAELQKFGFTPAKTPQGSTAAKSAGVSKSKATRDARGTKGKKQKALVKGGAVANKAPEQASTGAPSAGIPAGSTSAATKGAAS